MSEIVYLEGQKLIQAFEDLLDKSMKAKFSLDCQMMDLGLYLNEIRKTMAWKDAGYENYGKFIDAMEAKCDRGRTSLYGYAFIARELADQTTPELLLQMGINKARVLAQTSQAIGTNLKPETFETAAKPHITEQQLKQIVSETYCLVTPPEELSTWFPFNGFFVTEDERSIIEQGFDIAARTDPVIQDSKSRNKEVLIRLCQEFTGSWEGEVNGETVESLG